MAAPLSLTLDADFIAATKQKIEALMLPIMESVYLHDGEGIPDDFRPTLKYIERVVSYFDYYATGISVLAPLAARGDTRATILMHKTQKNMQFYRDHCYGHVLPGMNSAWGVPLRRLLFHLALSFTALAPTMCDADKIWWQSFVTEQVDIAIEHNHHFWRDDNDTKLYEAANNHTAIFMQGIYYCGRAFGRDDWIELTRDFAKRYFAAMHPDGYWDENANDNRQGGPSLVYTPLTAGCLYDMLDGQHARQKSFIQAGNFFRRFINADYHRIPLADERTNAGGIMPSYGLALHSLTPRGRYMIVDVLRQTNFLETQAAEGLAVLHHELDLMVAGEGEIPENRCGESARLKSLPLGVLREGSFTAGLSALKCVNHFFCAHSDYALDTQSMLYLSHAKNGVLLNCVKSKRDPELSSFRIGDDAYTVRTGTLSLTDAMISGELFYETFSVRVRWEIADDTATLLCESDARESITTTLFVMDTAICTSSVAGEWKDVSDFSPYAEGNIGEVHRTLQITWQGALRVTFRAAKSEA